MDLTDTERRQLVDIARMTRPHERGFVHELEAVIEEGDKQSLSALEQRGLVKPYRVEQLTTCTCFVAGHTWSSTEREFETYLRLTLDGIKLLEQMKPDGIDLVTVRVAFAMEPKRQMTGADIAKMFNA